MDTFISTWLDRESADEFVRAANYRLRRLALEDQFQMLPPKLLVERRKTGRHSWNYYSYQVFVRNLRPDDPVEIPHHLVAYWMASSPPPPTRAETSHLSAVKSAEDEEVAASGKPGPKPKTYSACGYEMSITEWAEAVGVSHQTLRNRLKDGEELEQILTRYAPRKKAS